jgi:hypothetical protein
MATLADILRQTGYAQGGTLATPAPVESPMTKAISDHIASLPQKFNENQAHQMDLLARAYPGNTFKSMMLEGDPKAMAELAMQVPIVGMTAYHGTPHKIKGLFDINKVGTGEGAQAYGHGMYFAEAPDVAKQYFAPGKHSHSVDKLIDNIPAKTWMEKSLNPIEKKAADAISRNPTAKDAISYLEQDASFDPLAKKAVEWLTVNESRVGTPGNLYKVDIPDEQIPNMLDWDKPLSQQPKALQDWLKSPYNYYKDKLTAKDVGGNEPTGSLIYNRLQELMSEGKKSDAFANQANYGAINASKELFESGIPGIRYLDEGSRTKGGTSNFVVFDPSTVKILEENAKPVSRKALIEEQVKKLKD